jgi:hypothetical protein
MRLRILLVCCAALALTVGVATATAGNGGNSANAKKCQKGGWQYWAQADGTLFASQDACVSYAAGGGVLTQTAATRCAARGGTFSTTGPILTGNMFGRTLIWVCNNAAPPTGNDDLTQQCFDDATALGWTQTLVSYAYTNNPRIDYTCGAIPA